MTKLIAVLALIAAAVPASAANFCAIRASDLVLDSKNAAQRMLVFVLVENKGKTPLDVVKMKSAMSVDGKAMPNWEAVVTSGAEPAWRALPPGGRIQFGVNLTEQLSKPGVHTLKMGGDCPSNDARVLTL